jgi:hypothetical protein
MSQDRDETRRDETRRDEVTKGGDETRSDLPVCMHAGPTSLKYALPVEARCQCTRGVLRTLPKAKHLKVKRLAMAEVPNG